MGRAPRELPAARRVHVIILYGHILYTRRTALTVSHGLRIPAVYSDLRPWPVDQAGAYVMCQRPFPGN
jgi:hypothetical protein